MVLEILLVLIFILVIVLGFYNWWTERPRDRVVYAGRKVHRITKAYIIYFESEKTYAHFKDDTIEDIKITIDEYLSNNIWIRVFYKNILTYSLDYGYVGEKKQYHKTSRKLKKLTVKAMSNLEQKISDKIIKAQKEEEEKRIAEQAIINTIGTD